MVGCKGLSGRASGGFARFGIKLALAAASVMSAGIISPLGPFCLNLARFIDFQLIFSCFKDFWLMLPFPVRRGTRTDNFGAALGQGRAEPNGSKVTKVMTVVGSKGFRLISGRFCAFRYHTGISRYKRNVGPNFPAFAASLFEFSSFQLISS